MPSRRACLVLGAGIGALLVQAVVMAADVIVRHANPITNQPRKP